MKGLSVLQSRIYVSTYRNFWLVLAIIPLHLLLWHPPFINDFTLLFLLHGLGVLIWLPFALGNVSVDLKPVSVIVLFGIIIIFSSSYLLLSLWILILASLLSGEPLNNKKEVAIQCLVILCLIHSFLLSALPKSFGMYVDGPYIQLSAYIMLFVLAILACIPQKNHKIIRQSDVLPSLVFFQAIFIFASTTLIYAYSTQTGYLESLMYAIAMLVLAFCFLNMIWLWFFGNSVLSLMWNRYLLVLGSPFENFLVRIDALSVTNSPAQFLENGFNEMYSLPWVTSIQWKADSSRGELGKPNKHELKIDVGDMTVRIFTHYEPNQALRIHARLIVQLICHYYHTIKRERSMAHRAHIQALYETGARLTHDIKNLLQGLKMLSAAGEQTQDAAAFHELFKKQIPSINERLEQTLRKLTEPNQSKQGKDTQLTEWWLLFKQRCKGRDVKLNAQIDIDTPVPAEMMDTISENLLDNARRKRMLETGIEIEVNLVSNSDGLMLSIIDTGSPVPAEKEQFLLSEPVRSDQGLGVGLYQSAAMAKQYNFSLKLNENINGLVSFSLFKETK